MPPRFVARQLSNPSGIGGWLVRLGMNRGNARVNAFAVDRLDVGPADKVVEVGFGGGPNLRRLMDRGASVVGIDRSPDAVAAATKLFAAECAQGRARFVLGNVEDLPIADGSCTKALTVHTVYFWRSLEKGFGEFYRALRPGGLLAVGFVPQERMETMGMPRDIFTMRTPEEVCGAAATAGFTADPCQSPGGAPWLVVLCRKGE
jgi:ubiquinone/menaquinone biosynthesis C-methylase UbiE